MMEVAARLFETMLSRARRRPAPGPPARGSKRLRAGPHPIDCSSPTRCALQQVSFAVTECSQGVTEPDRFRVAVRARGGKVFPPRRDRFFAAMQYREQE